MASFAAHARDLNGASGALAAGTLVFLFVAARLAPRAPILLLGVGLAAAIAAMMSLEDHGVTLVGDIPRGLPASPQWVSAADRRQLVLPALVLPALGLAVVAYTDNMLTGRAFAARHHEEVDAGQELLALAGANIAAAVRLVGETGGNSGSCFHQHVEAKRLQACHRVGDERDATLPHKGFFQHAHCQCAHGRFLDVVVISLSDLFAGARTGARTVSG